MASCEMCGKDEELVPALIEDVELMVCQRCTPFGKVIKRLVPAQKEREKKKKEKGNVKPLPEERELIQTIREDFPDIIRSKRERMGLKQEEFAKYLSEKESVIHKIESGSYTPSLELARKIEKQLGVSLVEEKEIAPEHVKAKKEIFTIGDVLKVK